MFTDGPVTPLRVESLLEFLQENENKKLTKDDIRRSFQPASVHNKTEQIDRTFLAAEQLRLTKETGTQLELLPSAKGKKNKPSTCLKRALDEHVLGSTKTEKYFALFYAYLLGLNENTLGKNGKQWAMVFNRDVFNNEKQDNQFNDPKHTGLHRWFSYLGLGWDDQNGDFNCNPYSRIERNLKDIFSAQKTLEGDTFIANLGKICPELDGGKIFRQANQDYDAKAKQCTLGLSHALVDLHLDSVITLSCPPDTDGWSIALAGTVNDLPSQRISEVKIGKGGKK